MEAVRVVRCYEMESKEFCLPKDSPLRFVEYRKALLNHDRLTEYIEILLSSGRFELPETQP